MLCNLTSVLLLLNIQTIKYQFIFVTCNISINQVDMINIFYNCLCEQVRWPNGNKSNYRFGYKDKHDLILW